MYFGSSQVVTYTCCQIVRYSLSLLLMNRHVEEPQVQVPKHEFNFLLKNGKKRKTDRGASEKRLGCIGFKLFLHPLPNILQSEGLF